MQFGARFGALCAALRPSARLRLMKKTQKARVFADICAARQFSATKLP